MSELKTKQIGLFVEPSLIEKIDAWRRLQPDLPSRSEAIRRMILHAVGGDKSAS